MKKLNWVGLLVCSSLAFGAAPGCGGDDDSSGDGDGDGDVGDGDGDVGDGDVGDGDGDVGDGDVGDGDVGDGDVGDGDVGDGDMGGGGGMGGVSGDGDMGGSTGDGDGDLTEPVIGQDCQDYCTDWFATTCNDHVEASNEFADQAECEARCEAFTTAVETGSCRREHLDNAMGPAPAAAETHCGHAAETPEGGPCSP